MTSRQAILDEFEGLKECVDDLEQMRKRFKEKYPEPQGLNRTPQYSILHFGDNMTEKQIDETTIFVGTQKPLYAYVNACMKATETSKTVKISGRGSVISDCVTIAEIFMRKLGKHEYTVEIGSVEMENKFHKNVFVSTMTITVKL